jgi:urease accessory protein
VTGHLRLQLAADAMGRTFIAGQSFHAPMHLSKPHWEGRYLIVQAVNCTAGMLAGDRLELAVEAGEGSSAVITSPSASRSFQARGGDGPALLEQSFSSASGAWLEVCPEIFIPHRGSCLVQTTRLEVQAGGALFFVESLAPGRVASGEAFLFERLEWTTELYLAGELTARERYALSPHDGSLAALRSHHAQAYYASCYLVAPALPPSFGRAVSALSEGEADIAASFLTPEAAVIKVLATGSIALRRALARLRELCYDSVGRRLPAWRKL